MVKHPAVYYAKYYVSRRCHTSLAIAEMLTMLDLGGMTENDVTELERGMRFPIPFCPASPDHYPSQSFLRMEGIQEAWQNTHDMARAKAILEEPELRQAMESMILSPVRPEAAVRRLQMRFGSMIRPEVYRLFEHYFWNRSAMSALDWGEFVGQRQTPNQEWLRIALNTKDSAGLRLLLWKMGMADLRRVEGNRVFTDARNLAHMFIQQMADRPVGERHARAFLAYVRAAKWAQEGIEATTDATQDVLEAFSTFRMRHVKPEVAAVKELTRGNYTPPASMEEEDEEIVF